MEWYHFWWCICTNYICTLIRDRCIGIYRNLLLCIWHSLMIYLLFSVQNPWHIWTRMTPNSTSTSGARRFHKIYRNLLLRIWHFLIIFCLISVRNPWRITSSFWTRMTPSSTSIFGGGISMPVVFATIRRCVMSVKNCIAPTKKPKSTRQGHSILQVYILRPGGTYSSGDMPIQWA